MNRRGFLLGLAAPALVRAASLDFVPRAWAEPVMAERFNPEIAYRLGLNVGKSGLAYSHLFWEMERLATRSRHAIIRVGDPERPIGRDGDDGLGGRHG